MVSGLKVEMLIKSGFIQIKQTDVIKLLNQRNAFIIVSFVDKLFSQYKILNTNLTFA